MGICSQLPACQSTDGATCFVAAHQSALHSLADYRQARAAHLHSIGLLADLLVEGLQLRPCARCQGGPEAQHGLHGRCLLLDCVSFCSFSYRVQPGL